jgi:hypothetical protein
MFRMLWQKKTLIVFVILLLVLLPAAISRPAQMTSKTILTEITIDKIGDEYMVKGKTKNADITAAGVSVGAAINTMSAQQGKQISLAHCSQIVLGDGLVGENLADFLQYFVYRTEINNNCGLSWMEKGRVGTIEKFYKNYQNVASTGIIGEGTTKRAVFMGGRYAFSLDETQSTALDFLRGKGAKTHIAHGNEVLRVIDNKSKIKTRFNSSGFPEINITVTVKMELESNPRASAETVSQLRDEVAIKLERDIIDILDYTYRQHADILDLYEKFRKYRHAKSFNDFISEISFNIKVDARIMT